MLLGSFAQVLNEKKLKIRNQQRLLASTNIDSEKGVFSPSPFIICSYKDMRWSSYYSHLVRELESTIDQEEEAPRSRRNKRKAPVRQQDNEPSDSDNEFEKMDIDKPKPKPSRRRTTAAKPLVEEEEEEEEEEADEDERLETPQPLEEETESEAEEERMASPEDKGKEEEQLQKSIRPNLTRAADPPPPPRRDLPFLRRDNKGADTAKKEVEKMPEQDEADEATGGETDDDEL